MRSPSGSKAIVNATAKSGARIRDEADVGTLGEDSHNLADAVLVTPPDLTHTH